MKSLHGALSFLTVLGHGGAPRPTSMLWFPVVGAALGAVVGGAWYGATQWWSAGIAAALVVLLDVLLTGALHYDGLADSADGLLPHADTARRLDIMRSPDVGAFAVVAVGALLLLRFAAFAGQEPSVWLVVGLWAASRSMAAATAALGRYARTEGLATDFLTGRTPVLAGVAVAGVLAGSAVAAVDLGLQGAAAVLAGTAAATGIAAVAHARVGGYTGDVLGAMILSGETVGLVVAAA